MKTVLVINPHSAEGSTGRQWERLRPAVLEALPGAQERFTSARGEAEPLAREALEEGADLVVGVGGDGTNNEIVNAFFREDGSLVRPEADFAILPRGTGCDFARCLGLPRDDAGEAARRVAEAEPWPIDIGRMELTGHDGAPRIRHFLNIIDFGIGGMVCQRVNTSSKRLGGFVSFLWHTLVSMVVYRNQPMEVIFDDAEPWRERFRTVVVANGRYFGGGMNIAPEAAIDDGRFEVLVIPDVGVWESVRHTPAVYGPRGLLDVDAVRSLRARRVEALPGEGAAPIFVQMDGESPGTLPMTVRLLPGALRLRAPRPAAPGA